MRIVTPKSRTMELIGAVARAHGVGLADILGTRRKPQMVAARMAAARKLHGELGFNACRIGRVLGKHHTTVYHYISADRRRQARDRRIRIVKERRDASARRTAQAAAAV